MAATSDELSSPPPEESRASAAAVTTLPFPPLTKSHILACSYSSWYPTFRPHTPKARVIPLPAPFTAYLRSDGIVLPASGPSTPRGATSPAISDEGFFSSATSTTSSSDSDDEDDDPSHAWPDTHAQIQAAIRELGGAVVPKLNWSAPKDAAWIAATNSLECRSANDVYLLLKSSDFVTHDLEHAFDGCADWQGLEPGSSGSAGGAEDTVGRGEVLEREIEYVLVLRKFFRLNPSLEFRVFVRDGKVVGIGQRDLNYYEFLFDLRSRLKRLILDFWGKEVRDVFKQPSYAMDLYIPPPHDRCWVVDFNPWDIRTDPGTWSWLELLTMEDPVQTFERGQEELVGEVVRMRLGGGGYGTERGESHDEDDDEVADEDDDDDYDGEEDDSELLRDTMGPEFRLVEKDDPEAYMFNSTRYSAHKLPRDVVDASQSGAGGLREFAEQWKDILDKRVREEDAMSSDADDDE